MLVRHVPRPARRSGGSGSAQNVARCCVEGRDLPQPLDDRRQDLDHVVHLVRRVVARQGEPDRAVGQGEGQAHGPQHVARLQAAAGAGRAAAGGHADAVQQQQDAFALDVLEADVGGVGQAVLADRRCAGSREWPPAVRPPGGRAGPAPRCSRASMLAGGQVAGHAQAGAWRPRSRCRRGGRAPGARPRSGAASWCPCARRARPRPWARAACGPRWRAGRCEDVLHVQGQLARRLHARPRGRPRPSP